jgi:flagellar motor switch protein FliN/FliY
MSSAASAPALHPFAESFRKAMKDVFSQSFGAAWTAEVSHEPQKKDEAATVWFGFEISGEFQGDAAIQFTLQDAALLARQFVTEPTVAPSEFSAEHKQTVEQLLRKVIDGVATNLTQQFGTMTAKVSGIDAPTWNGLTITLHVAGAASGSSFVNLRIGDNLVAAMASIPKPEAPAVTAPPPAPEPASDNQEAHIPVLSDNLDTLWGVDLGHDMPAIAGKDLDVLRKVALGLTMRFGTRTLILKDVLQLSSGSVIELDREVQGPADLLLGDKVVARGEVVIVDGNFGVRVTEVAGQRQQLSR